MDPVLGETGPVLGESLDTGPAESDTRWLFQIANRAWVLHDTQAGPEIRARRTAVNLALLRAPLAGVDLDSRDHATLTWLADHDADVIAAVHSLLDRARAAGAGDQHHQPT